jgi:glycosyltransferase involved in cell wall biosynthesis
MSETTFPLVTIVTPCYNSAQFIEETIQSVLAQTYPNIEYIIMDGGSSDGTAAIANRYADRLTVISEKDRGQTHAINKGWHRAKGEILAWLNADDTYFPDTVANAVAFMEAHPETRWIYGLGQSLDAHGTPMPFRHPVVEWDYTRFLTSHCFIIQPSVFLRREIFTTCGDLDETLHYGMDYEYWLRIGRQFPAELVPEVRSAVKIFRNTKTRSGGYQRIIEIEQMVKRYGANDLPRGMHHEWTMAVVERLGSHLRHFKLNEIGNDIRKLFRYPRTIPRGIAKTLFDVLVPPAMETRLRRWFVRSADAS